MEKHKKKSKAEAGRSKRRVNSHVPRRRMLKEAPPKVAAGVTLGREIVAVSFFVLSLFLALSLYSFLSLPSTGEARSIAAGQNLMGAVGLYAAQRIYVLLGWCSFVAVIWTMLIAATVWNNGWPAWSRSAFSLAISAFAFIAMAGSCAALSALFFGERGGGVVGSAVAGFLVQYVNKPGTFLFAAALLVISLGVSTGAGAGFVLAFLQTAARFVSTALEGTCRFAIGLLRKAALALLRALRRCGWLARKCALVLVQPIRGIPNLAGARRIPFVNGNAAGAAKPAWVKEAERSRRGLGQPEALLPAALPEPGPAAEQAAESDEEYEEADSEPIILRRDKKAQKKAANPVKPLKKKGSRAAGEEKPPEAVREPEREFMLPTTELLVSGEGGAAATLKDTDLIKNSRRLEQALRNFRIGGRVTEVHPGPVITLYQFEPAAGVKVQRIISLADDLALALKVESVRVFAPVPGKGTVGIEVPNEHREIVRLREVLESEEFQTTQAQLCLALGKDTYGAPVVVSLAKMPHLLIAGATGTGKSVSINSILTSLLFRYSPKELRLILIDPKMLELSVYEGIPHLKAPVITQAKRARGVLWWATEEMDRRYELMKALGVRDISMFNRIVGQKKKEAQTAPGAGKRKANSLIELEEKDVIATGSPYEGLDRGSEYLLKAVELSRGVEFEPMPRIVIVVDELADLMLTVGREIEELLTRLAQKARAAGLHLILATQRPSVNVITGLIKANFPARISFKVASKIDARTVMDTSGAEKLLGQGDMLFSSPALGRVKRLHSPYVSDKEVHDVVDWLRAQGQPDYDAAIEKMIERIEEAEAGAAAGGGGPDSDYDPLYDQAVNLVIEKGFASTSMVQRVFRIGYNRAARILEVMEREGVVGPADGAKPRQVLVGNSVFNG